MRLNKKVDCMVYFRLRYIDASSKKEKSMLINEVCSLYGYHRKATIRQLNKPILGPSQPKRGPKPTYVPEVFVPILKLFWFAADQPCGKRLKSLIPEWLPFYETEYGEIDKEVKLKLLSISSASIDRLLKPTRTQMSHKGRSGTKPGSLIKAHIPIKVDQWNENVPGFMEADTVALCGSSLAGGFVWCVTFTDIASTWTECRATWNKEAQGVLNQLKNIEENLPFPVLGFDSDNGSEFLNWHLISYYQDREEPVQVTRSRPYRKNDNAHVEQKNWSHVRQLFGYDRFNNECLVSLMNDLLACEYSQFQNHFMPSAKLISKERINSKYKKIYDKPITPYKRLMNCEQVPKKIKEELMKEHKTLNPFHLKQCIESKLKQIFKFVSVATNTRKRL